MATCSLPPRQDEAENEERKVLGGGKNGLIRERWFDKWGEWGEWGEGTNKGCKANHSPPPTGGVVPPVSKQQHPVCSQGLGVRGGCCWVFYGMECPSGSSEQGKGNPQHWAGTAQQQPKHWWVISTISATNSKHGTIWTTAKKINSIPLPKRMEHELLIDNT